MNFSPHSLVYNNTSQQSNQPNMNSYNNGPYYQSIVPQFTGYQMQYPDNYPYTTINYPPSQIGNFTQSSFYNSPSKSSDIPLVGPKRECKPLIVIDPKKNEAIDLVEVSKSTKSNLLLNETRSDGHNSRIYASLITVSSNQLDQDESQLNDKEETRNQEKDKERNHDELERIEQKEEEESKHEAQESNDHDKHQMTVEDISDATNQEHLAPSDKKIDRLLVSEEELDSNNKVPISSAINLSNMKYSHSIPNKLETLSCSVDKLQTSSSANNLNGISTFETEHEIEKGALRYDRDTMLKISKSSLCKKPKFDCKEIIELQSIKNYNLTSRLQNSVNSLIRTEHGYLPPQLREGSLSEYLETRRKFKSILNKIAPQNFDECFEKITAVIIKTDRVDLTVKDCMACLIEEIFDKAVQEEAYSVTYANLCTQIVKYEDKHDTEWKFKTLLIGKCQTMFVTPLQDQLKSVRIYWEKKTDEETNEKLKNLYKADIEEQVKKAKDKYFGNIRFIGELYIHDLLKPNIINVCVTALMPKRNDEDALLSLCKLLETCGKTFDTQHNDKMKEYIETMSEIVSTEKLHTRIKCRLLDIIEMSSRNWELRTIQAQKIIQPKTLDQVKKDDLDEKTKEASKLSNNTQIRLKNKPNVNNGDLKLKPPTQNRNQSLDINSLQMQTDSCLALKPSCKWQTGSGVKEDEWKSVEGKRNGRSNTKQYVTRSSKRQNRSSAIKSHDDESLVKISGGDIGGRFAMLHDNDNDNDNESDNCYLDNKYNSLPTQRQQQIQQQGSDNDIRSLPSTREQSPSNTCLLDGNGILDKLLESGIMDDKSWCQLNDVSQTITIWMDTMMEKNSTMRNKIGDELSQLVTEGKLSVEDLTEGIAKFAEEIDDLKPDIPLIWTFMAEFLERLIVSSESDISFYKTIFVSQRSQCDVAKCLALCLKLASHRLGHKIIKKVMKKCTWSFADFVANDQDFVRTHELDFLAKVDIDEHRCDQFRDDLISLLSTGNSDIDTFLATNNCPELMDTKLCVYLVSTAVFSHLSHLSTEDVSPFLSKQKLLFLKILGRRLQFEKQMIRALNDCAALFKNKEVLAAVINALGDCIISYEAFTIFVERHNTALDITYGKTIADIIRSMALKRTHNGHTDP